MAVVCALALQHILSVFCQSFFLHRYASHGQFSMSPRWEKFFYLMTFVCLGPSFLEPTAYAWLHREHHAFSDTERDPHSPNVGKNQFRWIADTLSRYNAFVARQEFPEPRFMAARTPEWPAVDALGRSRVVEFLWLVVYVAAYHCVATAWWQYAFVAVHFFMGRLHGLAVNWFGHRTGYRNFDNGDESTNVLPFEVLILGEWFQNNHHKFPMSPNFAARWFEFDPCFQVMRVLAWLKIINFGPNPQFARYPVRPTISS